MKKLAMTLMMTAAVLMLAAGCATKAKGPTDEEQISKRIQEGIANIKAKNFDAFKTFVSDKFDSGAVGDKESLLAFLKNADDMGYLDGIEVDLSGSKITVTGSTATVASIVANGRFGSLTLDFTGAKENKVWMITGLEQGY